MKVFRFFFPIILIHILANEFGKCVVNSYLILKHNVVFFVSCQITKSCINITILLKVMLFLTSLVFLNSSKDIKYC